MRVPLSCNKNALHNKIHHVTHPALLKYDNLDIMILKNKK